MLSFGAVYGAGRRHARCRGEFRRAESGVEIFAPVRRHGKVRRCFRRDPIDSDPRQATGRIIGVRISWREHPMKRLVSATLHAVLKTEHLALRPTLAMFG